MAKVSDIIFCLNGSNTPENGASANTIFAAMTPEYVPGLFTFSVIIVLLDLIPGTDHDVSISFIDPTGSVVANIGSPIHYDSDSSNLPNEYKGLNLGINWNNVDLKVSGLYRLQVNLDGNLIAERDIYVKGKNEQ